MVVTLLTAPLLYSAPAPIIMGNFITNLSYPCVAAAAVGVITIAYFRKQQCRKVADETIFKEPPQREECPICMLPLPLDAAEWKYQTCCGKTLCIGCIHAAFIADCRKLCPFCRAPEATSDGERIERIKKRVEADDAIAIHTLGYYYSDGDMGFPQDHGKAMELWLRAGDLGHATAYGNIASNYRRGQGVERDTKKSKYYAELAAMGGHVNARHNLGVLEAQAGNMERAMKHLMISAGAGDDKSLEAIRRSFIGT